MISFILTNSMFIYRWIKIIYKDIFVFIIISKQKMADKTHEDYILGVNEFELERLGFQHKVWKGVTDGFFDRLGIKKGMKILDAGSGPGFAAFDLLERTGPAGEGTPLEPNEMYLNYFKQE